MSKFFYNRATTKICAKKPFIVIECKILTMRKKKVNKRPIDWSKTRHILYFGFSENILSSYPIFVNEKLKIYGKNGENGLENVLAKF